MSSLTKSESEPTPVPAVTPPAADPVILLDEFCRRLSAQSRLTELIAAFHCDETQSGHLAATTTEFNQRLAAFRQRPVE